MDAIPKKRFRFNYSHLKNFESCPRRHYEVDVLRKWAKEPLSDQMKWGNRFHDVMAARLQKKTPLGERMEHYEDLAEMTESYPLPNKRTSIEVKLAFDNQFRGCDPSDPARWFDCKIDVLMLSEPQAIIFDWKTGDRKEKYIDWLQLALYAQAVFSNWPEVEAVGAQYIWVGDPVIKDPRVFDREAMIQIWNTIFSRLQPFMQAQETKHYPERENGFCQAWCPVTDCHFNGRR